MSEARALRIIAAQMADFESFRTDALGIEAACLRDAANRIEQLQDVIARIQHTNLRRDMNLKSRTIEIDRLCKPKGERDDL